MRRYIAAGILALLTTTGCAQDEPDSGIGQAESKMEPLVEAACDWMFTCCGANELTYQFGDFTVDANNCQARLIESIKAGVPLDLEQPGLSSEQANGLLVLALSINEGRVDVDSSAVNACADATTALACNTLAEVTPTGRCNPDQVAPVDPCDPNEMFTGRQKVGEECSGPWECEEGLRCLNVLNTAVCASTSAEGEFCYSDLECGTGLICDYTSGLCTPGALAGESCAFADPERPVPGTETTRCAAGLSCDPTSNTCSRSFCSPGAPCVDIANDSDCPEGTYCVVNEDIGATCRTPAPAGVFCNKDLDCASGYCEPFDSRCADRLPDGSPCNFSEDCQSGFCDFGTGACSPAAANGQPCPTFDDAECANGYCDTAGVAGPECTAYAGNGGPCPNGFECDPEQDIACVDGTCRETPLPNGTSCFSPFECESTVCFMGECTQGAAFGSACSTDGSMEPCVLGAFCDTAADPNGINGTCTELRRSGEACERSEECWGECVVRFGQFMCDATPAFLLDELWCDGAG